MRPTRHGRMAVAAACVVLAAALPAGAQTLPSDGARPGNEIGTGMSLPRSDKAGNIDAAHTTSEIAPNLPAPVGAERIADLLLTARIAIKANQTGAAQEALERAETRALTRSVPYGAERNPAGDPLTRGIHAALADIGSGDLAAAVAAIDGLQGLAAAADRAGD